MPTIREYSTPSDTEPPTAKPGDDRIEIVLARGRRVIIGAGVDAAALSRVLDVLERR